METISQLRKIRLQKLQALIDRGVNPYPAHFLRTNTIAQARSKKQETNVCVAGRLVGWRGHGKASFGDLQDASGQIQLFFTEVDVGDTYPLLEFLDIGDFIGTTGELTRTKAGELSVKVKTWTLLTKSLRPLPSEWFGLKDVETRYRKRYLDLLLNPEGIEMATTRSRIVSAMRVFMDSREFLEVETPTIQPLYGGANARPFTTHHNALNSDFYLKISDELYLKRLIVGGFEKVYEIDKDFRNEGTDRTHGPEFTMFECYQAYADYQEIMRLTEDIYAHIAQAIKGDTKIEYQGQKIDLERPWKRLTMEEALAEHAGLKVSDMSDGQLKAVIKKHNLTYEGEPTITGVGKGWQRGIAIATLFELVEDKLVQPTFITDFPIETSPLAKVHRTDTTKVERFELFINGWEMANAYSEQNDPLAQRDAFASQVEAAKSGDQEAHPMDEDYLEALEYGMPPTGGLGIGIDRLVMLFTNARTFRDVVLFPTLKPYDGKTK